MDAAPAPSPDPAEIVAALDRATKVRLLSGSDRFALEALPEHGLDGIDIADGPHGLRHQASGGDHLGLAGSVPATCFPTASALGSTWDVALLEEVGVALGEEAVEQGVAVILGPGINIKRHPAGGRCFEYLSEDPLLSGKLAAGMIRGIQSQGIGTSLKHYAVNNHESHRLIVDALVDERTLREIYLAGFEIAVKESAPWTVMCSYNLVNGTYASEHHHLLQEVLRDEWGFEGLVMTDWGAANDRVAGIRAGLDLEMPGSNGAYDGEVLAALASGALDEADVDRCAERVVALLADPGIQQWWLGWRDGHPRLRMAGQHQHGRAHEGFRPLLRREAADEGSQRRLLRQAQARAPASDSRAPAQANARSLRRSRTIPRGDHTRKVSFSAARSVLNQILAVQDRKSVV